MTIPVIPGNDFDEILDRCLRAIERNRATIESCAARYPEYLELGDLLKTALAMRQFSAVEMPAAVTAKTRQQLQAQLRKSAKVYHPRPRSIQILFRLAAAFAAVAIV